MDDRYNASYRLMPSTIPAVEASISRGPAKSEYYVRRVGSVARSEHTDKKPNPVVRVSHSLLMPLRLTRYSSLFWSIGKVVDDEDTAAVLSLSLVSEAEVRPEICVPLPGGDTLPDDQKADLLWQVALLQISSLVLDDLEEGDKVLLLESDPALAELLRAERQERDVEVICLAVANDDGNAKKDFIRLHSNAAERDIQALGLDSVAVFVDFGVTEESKLASQRIQRYLPTTCKRETIQSLFGGLTRAHAQRSREKMQASLERLVSNVCHYSQPGTASGSVISLSEVDSLSGGPLAHRTIVNWTTESQVPAFTEPIDTHPIFSGNKTYWLVGLTGSLGLSLCEWMIRAGARHIAISSRVPKVEPAWLKMVEVLGANVRVVPW